MLRPIHDRMPVILDPADYALWLGEEPETLAGGRSLLKPFPAEAMVAYPVSKRVSNPAHDDPQCIEPLRAAIAKPTRTCTHKRACSGWGIRSADVRS